MGSAVTRYVVKQKQIEINGKMKVFAIIALVACCYARPHHNSGRSSCQNLGNDDCAIWFPEAGNDDDFINPGKRCANLGNDDCAIWFPDAGSDDDFIDPGKRALGNDDFINTPEKQQHPEQVHSMPGKRCANLGNDDCAIWLPEAGGDDDFIDPGKRCANLGNDDCAIWFPDLGDEFLTPGKRSTSGQHYNRGHGEKNVHNLRKNLQDFYKKLYHV
ncbi:hypothetical protein CBL_20941 [Carabus blaptoides fortunei]